MWVHKGTIEMQISSPFPCVLVGGAPVQKLPALLPAVCFQKGSACAEKCFDFFLFQSTKKLFSVSANF